MLIFVQEKREKDSTLIAFGYQKYQDKLEILPKETDETSSIDVVVEK